MANYELWYCDSFGRRIREISTFVNSFKYAKSVNEIGAFSLAAQRGFLNLNNILPDSQIQIWRGSDDYKLQLAFLGLARNFQFINKEGEQYLVVSGPDINEILRRRICLPFDPEPSLGVDLGFKFFIDNLPIDDGMKQVVREHMGEDVVIADRQFPLLEVDPNLSLGPNVYKEFRWKNVLSVLQDLAKTSRTLGTEVFFELKVKEIDPVTFIPTFIFRTYTDQPGRDLTWNPGQHNPQIFGETWQNIANTVLEYDFIDVANYIYAAGQGQKTSRKVKESFSQVSIDRSAYGRIEGFKDARNTETENALQNEADAYLSEKRAVVRFSGEILNTPTSRFGEHWFYGDKITISDETRTYDVIIRNIMVSVDETGEEKVQSKFNTGIVI